MLIPLRQLSLLPSPSSPSSPSNKSSQSGGGGMTLLPKGIQHPRFEEKVGGKGSWILCNSLALSQLATKGSYKRLNTNLTMSRELESYTEAQLVRRVGQEVEMWCERAKSWPASKSLEFEPVRRVTEMRDLEREGERVEMVLDLRHEEGKIVEWIRVGNGGDGKRDVPVWRIGGIVRKIVVPPSRFLSSHTSSLPILEDTISKSITGAGEASTTGAVKAKMKENLDSQYIAIKLTPSPLLESMKAHLDSTISLFQRRQSRLASASTAIDSTLNSSNSTNQDLASRSNDRGEGLGEIYVFYSPILPSLSDGVDEGDREVVRRMKKDLVDLWISCWRIGLWKGEGWEE